MEIYCSSIISPLAIYLFGSRINRLSMTSNNMAHIKIPSHITNIFDWCRNTHTSTSAVWHTDTTDKWTNEWTNSERILAQTPHTHTYLNSNRSKPMEPDIRLLWKPNENSIKAVIVDFPSSCAMRQHSRLYFAIGQLSCFKFWCEKWEERRTSGICKADARRTEEGRCYPFPQTNFRGI